MCVFSLGRAYIRLTWILQRMEQPNRDEKAGKPSVGIVAVAVALFLGSVLILGLSVWFLSSMVERAHNWNQFVQSISTFVDAMFFGLALLQVGFSLAGIVVSAGLLRLREGARKAAIFLCVIPPAILASSVAIFFGAARETEPGGTAAGYAVFVYGAFLFWMLPLSIWWLVALTREGAKAQFVNRQQ